ncbi:MAG: glycosyltransferase [Alphaproteobacteria bacterium]|nr:glycosyltransferase [Alphaproteobacteria bacterium]MCL2505355.1 glycosyltransferase [Alphaproteobacteria bacterium]
MLTLAILGILSLCAWIYLFRFHNSFWLLLFPEKVSVPTYTPSVDIIVPMRNEAAMLHKTLPALLKQNYSGDWNIILVDDNSTDQSSGVAESIKKNLDKSNKITILKAPPLKAEWLGKVAAMDFGVQNSSSELILFTDADIYHTENSLTDLVAGAEDRKIDLLSRMAKLNSTNTAEKLLIPAFVFFFSLLYPFRQVNNSYSKIAAAAGGTMLIRRVILETIGGLEVIKSEIIDDCALAKAVKNNGFKIELALTNDIVSIRPYANIDSVSKMIARTAYTQLEYSPFNLVKTILAMSLLFLVPLVLLAFGVISNFMLVLGILIMLAMSILYAPMVQFYYLPIPWVLSLPFAAFIYMAATIDSARLYTKGKGGQWKDRFQA